MKLQLVVDTNILISALGWKGGKPYQLLQKCFNGELVLVLSPDIIEEFKEVALRPRLGFSPEEVDEFISALLEISHVVQPEKIPVYVLEDPDDDKIIAAAIAGKAHYLVSGDRHLLKLKQIKGIAILSPAEFLKFVLNEK